MAVCQDQIVQGTMQIKDAMNELERAAEMIRPNVDRNSRVFTEMAQLAGKANEAMARLIERARDWRNEKRGENNQDDSMNRTMDSVLECASGMLHHLNDTSSIVNGARALTVACTQAVNLLKKAAEAEKVGFMT
jgi:hypothetical protein